MKWKLFSLILILLLPCGCSQKTSESRVTVENWEEVGPGRFPSYDIIAEQRANDLANFAFSIHSVKDYFFYDDLDSVLVVEFPEPGVYTTRSFNAWTQATVLQVLKGDESLISSNIKVTELMRRDENGKYLCRYLSDQDMTRAIICAHYDAENDQYTCTTPEWQIILLNDDDTLAIWPFLEGAEEYGTLEKFTGLAAALAVGPGRFPDHDIVAERRQNSMASYADGVYEVRHLIKSNWYTEVLIVTFTEPGASEILQFGEIEYDEYGNMQDYRSFGAEAQATVDAVIKGDTGLVGATITVGEQLIYSEAGWQSRYLSDPTLKRAIICTHHDDSYYAYVCHTPEWTIIPIYDDGSILIWPFVEGADEITTLQAFITMAEECLKDAESQSPQEPITVELTPEQCSELTAMLNLPENNGMVRSEYPFLTEIDLDEALILTTLPTDTVTQAELNAYNDQTGSKAAELLKIDADSLRDYLAQKFTSDETVFSNFTWVYIKEYDAWYHLPYTTQSLEVTVTGGTVQDVIYTIHYTFIRDGKTESGTLVYNDFGNLSYFESNEYH